MSAVKGADHTLNHGNILFVRAAHLYCTNRTFVIDHVIDDGRTIEVVNCNRKQK
jgi:hypothetical protein